MRAITTLANQVEATVKQKVESFRAKSTGLGQKDVAPSLSIQSYYRGEKISDLYFGADYKYFDFASLTKVMFPVSWLMLFKTKANLEQPLSLVFPELGPWANEHRASDLLTHSAGLEWWKPFYSQMPHPDESQVSPKKRWDLLIKMVIGEIQTQNSGERRLQSVYSDLDFLMLGEWMRRSENQDLASLWAMVQDHLGFRDVFFTAAQTEATQSVSYSNHSVRSRAAVQADCAPTELDSLYRNRLLQGEVHDENAASLGGIAPHSGLFGPPVALARFGLEVRAVMRGAPSKFPREAEKFLKRAVPESVGDWALGWMMPSKSGSTAGRHFSADSVGHTGFTGTSIWYDPVRDLLVTIASNRVHPTREKRGFEELRPAIHDWIVESLEA